IAVNTPPATGQPGAWRVGDTDKFVTWTASGQLGQVMIELDPDGAGPAGFTEITNPASRPNASAGNWAVSSWNPGSAIADFKTDQAVLRVTRVAGGSGTQVSGTSGAFSIYPKITNVTVTPGAGEGTTIWRAAATNQTVSWTDTSTSLGAVDVLINLQDGNGYTLASTTNGVKSATTLTVPTTMSAAAVVRVQDDNAAWAGYVQADSASF